MERNTPEDELFVDFYSIVSLYLGPMAQELTARLINLLKTRDILCADGEIFEVSNFSLGDSQGTVWFPDWDPDYRETMDEDSDYWWDNYEE